MRDETLQELIEAIPAAGPRALAIDLYRDLPVPPSPNADPARDSQAYRDLGVAILADPRVVMIKKFPHAENDGTPPPGFL